MAFISILISIFIVIKMQVSVSTGGSESDTVKMVVSLTGQGDCEDALVKCDPSTQEWNRAKQALEDLELAVCMYSGSIRAHLDYVTQPCDVRHNNLIPF